MSARVPICTVCGREVPADVLGDLAAAGDAPQLDFLTCGNQECIDVLDQEERSAARETKARDARSRAERRWREFERFVGAPIRDLNDDESFRELRDVARPIIRSRSPAGKVVTKKQLADFALSCVEPAVAALATAEDRERIALWVREGDVSHHAVRLSGFDLVALLNDRKSVMRSPMAPQPDPYVPGENVHSPSHPAAYIDSFCYGRKTDDNPRGMTRDWCWWSPDDRMGPGKFRCPFGVPGHRLWVQETWWQAGKWVGSHPEDDECSEWKGSRRVHYDIDGDPPNEPNQDYPNGLRNGAFAAAHPDLLWRRRASTEMQRWASRFTLVVRDIRVERLHDITEEDAALEGIRAGKGKALDGFAREWDGAHRGLATRWEANPLVWRVAFVAERRSANR